MSEATTKEKSTVTQITGEVNPASLDLIFTEVKDRLDVQVRQIETLDGKFGRLLFVSSLLISIGAAAQAAILGSTKDYRVMVVFSIPIFFYLVTMSIILNGWAVRPYFRDPEPRPLRDHYLVKEVQFTKRRLITHFISSYEWNVGVIKRKVRNLRISIWLFLFEITSITVVLLARPWLS